jgi:hypothetical protein
MKKFVLIFSLSLYALTGHAYYSNHGYENRYNEYNQYYNGYNNHQHNRNNHYQPYSQQYYYGGAPNSAYSYSYSFPVYDKYNKAHRQYRQRNYQQSRSQSQRIKSEIGGLD